MFDGKMRGRGRGQLEGKRKGGRDRTDNNRGLRFSLFGSLQITIHTIRVISLNNIQVRTFVAKIVITFLKNIHL